MQVTSTNLSLQNEGEIFRAKCEEKSAEIMANLGVVINLCQEIEIKAEVIDSIAQLAEKIDFNEAKNSEDLHKSEDNIMKDLKHICQKKLDARKRKVLLKKLEGVVGEETYSALKTIQQAKKNQRIPEKIFKKRQQPKNCQNRHGICPKFGPDRGFKTGSRSIAKY